MNQDTLLRLYELIQLIEMDDFAARINMHSGFSAVKLALATDPAVEEISGMCRRFGVARGVVLNEIRLLSNTAIDLRYESPYDIPLAAMFLVVRSTDPSSVNLISSFIQRAPQLSWARRIVNEQLQGQASGLAQSSEWETDVEMIFGETLRNMELLHRLVSIVQDETVDSIPVTDLMGISSDWKVVAALARASHHDQVEDAVPRFAELDVALRISRRELTPSVAFDTSSGTAVYSQSVN